MKEFLDLSEISFLDYSVEVLDRKNPIVYNEVQDWNKVMLNDTPPGYYERKKER